MMDELLLIDNIVLELNCSVRKNETNDWKLVYIWIVDKSITLLPTSLITLNKINEFQW